MEEMKEKSLRQMARESGVSESYLSQIMNGKRPASAKVISKMRQIDKQKNAQNGTIFNDIRHGGVLELADRQDLGSCVERRVGSSPTFPTTYIELHYDTSIPCGRNM